MTLQFSAIFLLTTLYAVIRYNLFGPVSPENIPVFIMNKSISFAAAAYLLMAAYHAYKTCLEKVRYWGKMSYYMSIVHAILSLSILTSDYFPKLFHPERMNIWGEMTIICGALGMFTYWYIPKAVKKPTQIHYLHLFSSVMLALHVFFLGARGWLKPDGWHGSMPPITMWGFVLALGSFILFSMARAKNGDLKQD